MQSFIAFRVIIRSLGRVLTEEPEPVVGTLSSENIEKDLELRRRIFTYERSDMAVTVMIIAFFLIFIIVQFKYMQEIWKHILLYFIKSDNISKFKALTCNRIHPDDFLAKYSTQDLIQQNPEDLMNQEFVKKVDEKQDAENNELIMKEWLMLQQ